MADDKQASPSVLPGDLPKTGEKTKPNKPKAKVKTADTIWVRNLSEPKPDGSDQVVLWQRDARHPNGEAFVAGDKLVEVYLTPEVAALIREGKLEEVEAET